MHFLLFRFIAWRPGKNRPQSRGRDDRIAQWLGTRLYLSIGSFQDIYLKNADSLRKNNRILRSGHLIHTVFIFRCNNVLYVRAAEDEEAAME